MAYFQHPYPIEKHDELVKSGDPKALAYEWIKGYASNLSGSTGYGDEEEYCELHADELISTAITHINPGRWGGDYLVKGGLLEGVYTDPTFWEKLSVFMGFELTDDLKNTNFFSCSC